MRKSNNLKQLRKLWLNLHLTLALSVGFIFVILGLTGSVNVFHWELEEAGLPEVIQQPMKAPLDLDAIMQTLRKQHPQRNGRWMLFMPGYERNYIWAVYPKPEEKAGKFFSPLRVQINPYSGDIVSQHFWGDTLATCLYSLHASFMTGPFFGPEVGRIGFNIISFLGLIMIISILTGLYLWWPNPGKFSQSISFKRQTSMSRRIYDLHKIIGVYSVTILFVIAVSGFSFGYKDYIKPIVTLFSSVNTLHFNDPKGLKSKAITGQQPISIMAALAVADRMFPYAELRWLVTPEGPEGVYAIEKKQAGEANSRRPRSKVWIDQYSSEVLAMEDPKGFSAGETFFNLLWPLHNGEAFGLPGRILWCMVGLTPLILYVTGIMRWLQKRKAGRLKKQRISTAPSKID